MSFLCRWGDEIVDIVETTEEVEELRSWFDRHDPSQSNQLDTFHVYEWEPYDRTQTPFYRLTNITVENGTFSEYSYRATPRLSLDDPFEFGKITWHRGHKVVFSGGTITNTQEEALNRLSRRLSNMTQYANEQTWSIAKHGVWSLWWSTNLGYEAREWLY